MAHIVAQLPGTFYIKPSPEAEPYKRPGDPVAIGDTIGMIEVMKTFSRVLYGGDALPARARVRAILLADESDVAAGDGLLELEAVGDETAKPHP